MQFKLKVTIIKQFSHSAICDKYRICKSLFEKQVYAPIQLSMDFKSETVEIRYRKIIHWFIPNLMFFHYNP